MKCNSLGWLLGLPILALVWGLAVQGERAGIIRDLEQRAQASLADAELDWAQAEFDITEGRISGAAYSEAERAKAIDVVQRVWGVWRLRDDTALIAKAPNYVWGAAIRDDNLHLSGFVPNERARRQILQVARQRFPSHAVQDGMRPARGAPGEEIWIDGISFGLRQLMQLKQGGRVDLHGTKLGISGEAETVTAYRSIRGDMARRMPSGIMLARDEVSPPRVSPYTWQATYKANQIEISGHVPTGKVHDKIVEIAKQAFPKAAIVDKTVDASGAPDDWLKAVSAVLTTIAPLQEAVVKFSDRRVNVQGLAVKEVTSERVVAALRVGMPDNFELVHDVKFQEPTLPTVTPFTTTLTSDGENVSLTGYAPNERSRQRLVAAAKAAFAKREIVDAMAYANGAPAGWLTCADAAIIGLAGLDKGRAELSGAVLRITGETRDEKAATALPAKVRAAANRACKDTIQIEVITPPEPKLKWQAVSLDKRLELTGEVINSQVKATLLADAKKLFPGYEIVDEMRVSPASSSKWEKVVRLGLAQLAKLRSGVVRLDALVLTLDGVAPDTAASTQVKSRIERGIAAGYTGQAKIEVKSDAMIWSEQEAKRKSVAAAAEAQRKKAEAAARAKSLEEVQRRAADAAAKARAEAEARRRLEAERKAARERAEAQRKADAAAARERAEAEARARRAAEAEKARAEAEAKARKALATQRAAQCKEELNEIARKGGIRFKLGSDQLTKSGQTTLDRLIEAYQNCPGAIIEIAGHTDSTGSAAANLKLSQGRAETVLEYFVSRGLPRDRLAARGYGETQPRASNRTATNRALNRRIEFDVRSN